MDFELIYLNWCLYRNRNKLTTSTWLLFRLLILTNSSEAPSNPPLPHTFIIIIFVSIILKIIICFKTGTVSHTQKKRENSILLLFRFLLIHQMNQLRIWMSVEAFLISLWFFHSKHWEKLEFKILPARMITLSSFPDEKLSCHQNKQISTLSKML